MFQHMRGTAVRFATSVIVLGFLSLLGGCDGGGGGRGGKTATQTPGTSTTAPTLKSIEVTPSLPQAAAGTNAQLTATGVYTDNSKRDLTTQVSWASSNSDVATVSNAAGSNGLAIAVTVGTTTVSATSAGVTGQTTLTVTDATLAAIEVSPATPSIANGLSRQFAAIGLYSDNSTQDLTAQVTWASSEGGVATISNAAGSNGRATAAGVGNTTISASSAGVTGETTLVVTDASLVSVEVSPATPSIMNGLTQQFTAIGLYTDHSTQDLTSQVNWGSSAGAVATISNATGSKGLATTASAGTTTVSATTSGVTGQTTLTVSDAPLVSIEVSPVAPSIANGLTQQFTALGLYADNSTHDLTTEVIWASSDSAVATVSNADNSNGLATTAGIGTTIVSATSGGVAGETTLTVTDATLVSIEVSPATPTVANGLTRQFTATGLYTDNTTQNLTTQVTWASSESTVATVSNADGAKGLATTAGVGTTTVSATSVGVIGETTLTVTDATLVSIEVSPVATSVADGLTRQFTATGHYSDNSTQDLTTQVTWASSESTVATVSNADGAKGLATTAGVGTTTVSATSEGVVGETTLTVTDAALVSIDVSPAAASVVNGLSRQFTATGHYTDNSTQDVTAQVTWASTETGVATVSNADGSNGLAITAGVGTTTVSATIEGVTGEATLTVTNAALVSIDVSPAATSIVNGLSQQFTATGHYTDSSAQDLTAQVAWASSETGVATVSNADGSHGLATAVSGGTTIVSASSGDVTGTTTLTVTEVTSSTSELVEALLNAVAGVGPGQSLTRLMTDVRNYLAVPDVASACTSLDAFKATVSDQRGKSIDAVLADQLTADADAIDAAIPCP